MKDKETRYQKLCEEVASEYNTLDKTSSLAWIPECKEINLWTYWQGRGHLSPKILLVGQDWGCGFDSLGKKFTDNTQHINENDTADYFHGISEAEMYVTDLNLIELFMEIGYDITKQRTYPDLFFTNICLGYRSENEKNSGSFEKIWNNHENSDKEHFLELVKILEPKVILCLGRSVYKGVMEALHEKPMIGQSYNRCIEEKSPRTISVDDFTVKVFALAHPGAMGTLNRNNKKDSSLDKQIEDWRKILTAL